MLHVNYQVCVFSIHWNCSTTLPTWKIGFAGIQYSSRRHKTFARPELDGKNMPYARYKFPFLPQRSTSRLHPELLVLTLTYSLLSEDIQASVMLYGIVPRRLNSITPLRTWSFDSSHQFHSLCIVSSFHLRHSTVKWMGRSPGIVELEDLSWEHFHHSRYPDLQPLQLFIRCCFVSTSSIQNLPSSILHQFIGYSCRALCSSDTPVRKKSWSDISRVVRIGCSTPDGPKHRKTLVQ